MSNVDACAHGMLARVAIARGDRDAEMEQIDVSVALFRDIGDRRQVAGALADRAVFIAISNPPASAAVIPVVLAALLDLGNEAEIASQLETATFVLAQAGRHHEAATLAAASLRWEKPTAWDTWTNSAQVGEIGPVVSALVSNPRHQTDVARGRLLATRAVAEAAIEWLQAAYPPPADVG